MSLYVFAAAAGLAAAALGAAAVAGAAVAAAAVGAAADAGAAVLDPEPHAATRVRTVSAEAIGRSALERDTG